MSKNLVVIPTYREKENIHDIINVTLNLPVPFDILVVDDASPDGTAKLVKREMRKCPHRVHIIERAGKLGLGTAYITGFRWGMKKGYDYICEMDADFSHNPEDLIHLREACEKGADIAIGSRYLKGVNVINWPIGRVLMSLFASYYVRIIIPIIFTDRSKGVSKMSKGIFGEAAFGILEMKVKSLFKKYQPAH